MTARRWAMIGMALSVFGIFLSLAASLFAHLPWVLIDWGFAYANGWFLGWNYCLYQRALRQEWLDRLRGP